ncbi:unnamed protein product, partial [Polarella glacialis]
VDPSLLPACGMPSMPAHFRQDGQLSARQERLATVHLQHQAKRFARIGNARIYGHTVAVAGVMQKTPRNMAESAYSGIPLQSTRFDSRLKGMGAKFRNPDLDKLIDAIRVRAEGLGFTSTRQFQELFKVMDVDGRGMLDMGEFVKGLKDRGLVQTQEECDLIFLHFDEDRSGFIEPGEFLNAMKGNLSDRRRAVVREAFASMDANGDGVLTTEDLKMKYQSFSHPDITSGKRTEEEIFGEFLKSFDVISA